MVKEVLWKDSENYRRSSEFIVSPTVQLQRKKGMCCLVTIVVEGSLVKVHHSFMWALVGSESFRGLGMFGHWWSCHISRPLQSKVSQCAQVVPFADSGSADEQAWQPGPTFCCWPVRRSSLWCPHRTVSSLTGSLVCLPLHRLPGLPAGLTLTTLPSDRAA